MADRSLLAVLFGRRLQPGIAAPEVKESAPESKLYGGRMAIPNLN